MKKLFVTLSVLVALICLLAACENESPNVHTHSYGEWSVTRESTCARKGEEQRACSCGEYEARAIPAVKIHTWGTDNICTVCRLALKYTKGLSFELSDDGSYYSLSGIGTAKEDEIVVPFYYEGKPVKRIANSAFSSPKLDSFVTAIAIPDIVTEIGPSAFAHCTKLETVTFGEKSGLERIGSSAFSQCHRLQAIVLPDSLTSIEGYAFHNCVALSSVTMPKSVTRIGEQAFSRCETLKSITLPDSLIEIGFEVFEGCSALRATVFENGEYLGSDENPYLYLRGVADTTVTSFRVLETTRFIGKDAFADCLKLTEVHIPDLVLWCKMQLEGFTANPLYMAKNLYVDGELVTHLEIPSTVTRIADGAFAGCTSIVSVSIPMGVTEIGTAAFSGCTALQSVLIQESVLDIGDFVFKGCTSMTSVVIPKSVVSIGSGAFRGCSLLTAVTFANASGWRIGEGMHMPPADFTDPAKAAEYLTSIYYDSQWKRTEE